MYKKTVRSEKGAIPLSDPTVIHHVCYILFCPRKGRSFPLPYRAVPCRAVPCRAVSSVGLVRMAVKPLSRWFSQNSSWLSAQDLALLTGIPLYFDIFSIVCQDLLKDCSRMSERTAGKRRHLGMPPCQVSTLFSVLGVFLSSFLFD